MQTKASLAGGSLEPALGVLSNLRVFEGAPKEFWLAYLSNLAELCGASRAALLLRDPIDQAKWRKMGEWSAQSGPAVLGTLFEYHLHSVADQAAAQGRLTYPLAEANARAGAPTVLGVRLRLKKTEDVCVAALLLAESGPAEQALDRAQLVGDVPLSYQTHQISRQANTDVEKLATALDIATQVNSERRFLAAALALCNGIATRFQCDRVSLGWLEGGYARLRAISRTEKFERKMAAAQLLEAAMDETLDQDEEIIWPQPKEATYVARDHERFAHDQRISHLISFPLRWEDKAVAVVTCERQSRPFVETEWQQLRLCCDQVTPRLADLKHQDRWFGARWKAGLDPLVAKWIGPQHTWAKIIALIITLLLALFLFVPVPYRVEATFLIKSEELSFLSAPFDSYISEVLVRPGDAVTKNTPLVRLDTRQVVLEESMALADLERYTREAEKARAARALAEMRIAQSMAQQAKARLDLTRYRIEQAEVKPPFDGVVVEGDLRERLAAPVKQGDALYKVARLDTMYVEAEVNERDVHEILEQSEAEIAFVSQPKRKYPIRLSRIEPAAFPKEGQNLFVVRGELVSTPDEWWRPGMSGLCKINAGKRTLFYIFTHRTVDFLRMWLWW